MEAIHARTLVEAATVCTLGAPNVARLLERGGVDYVQRTGGAHKRTINVSGAIVGRTVVSRADDQRKWSEPK